MWDTQLSNYQFLGSYSHKIVILGIYDMTGLPQPDDQLTNGSPSPSGFSLLHERKSFNSSRSP